MKKAQLVVAIGSLIHKKLMIILIIIKGFWSKDKIKTKTLPFSLERVEKFNLEDFLVKANVKAGTSADLTYDERIIKNYFTQKSCKDFRVDKEILANNKRYIQFSGFGGCNGNVNRPWAFYEVSENGGLTKLYEEEISNGEMLALSPNQDKLVLISGTNGGACSNINFLKILNLSTKNLVNLWDKSYIYGKYNLYNQFDEKWLDNNTLQFTERKLTGQDCKNNTNNLNKFDEIKAMKIK